MTKLIQVKRPNEKVDQFDSFGYLTKATDVCCEVEIFIASKRTCYISQILDVCEEAAARYYVTAACISRV